jgi:hypothetical protein
MAGLPQRAWGRVYAEDGTYTWTIVTPDANGNLDAIYITALIQTLRLNLNESPFWASIGIPAHPSVISQLYPNYYVNRIQQFYAPFFANLTIVFQGAPFDAEERPVPTWDVNVLTKSGFSYSFPGIPAQPPY